jgi:hypothetical protein
MIIRSPWGDYRLVGTYDGTSFTVIEAGRAAPVPPPSAAGALEGSGPGAQHGRGPADAGEHGEQQYPGDGGEPSDPKDLVADAFVDVSSSQARA